MRAQLLNAFFGLQTLFLAFEQKGRRHDAYRQNPQFLCYLRNNRGSAGTGATAHTSRDKKHFGTLIQQLTDLLLTFQRGLAAALWLGPRTEAFG